ncbi:unnamed protein product, partial [Urochloa humidicola]
PNPAAVNHAHPPSFLPLGPSPPPPDPPLPSTAAASPLTLAPAAERQVTIPDTAWGASTYLPHEDPVTHLGESPVAVGLQEADLRWGFAGGGTESTRSHCGSRPLGHARCTSWSPLSRSCAAGCRPHSAAGEPPARGARAITIFYHRDEFRQPRPSPCLCRCAVWPDRCWGFIGWVCTSAPPPAAMAPALSTLQDWSPHKLHQGCEIPYPRKHSAPATPFHLQGKVYDEG